MFKTKSVKSILLVSIQFLSILIILFSGRIIPENLFLKILIIISSIPAIWAIILMNTKLSAVPEVKKDAKLLEIGPYKIIRHPMYTSLISISLIYVFDNFNFIRLIAFSVLVINLYLKMLYEEKLLEQAFSGYT